MRNLVIRHRTLVIQLRFVRMMKIAGTWYTLETKGKKLYTNRDIQNFDFDYMGDK
jgi:hypothetical protein